MYPWELNNIANNKWLCLQAFLECSKQGGSGTEATQIEGCTLTILVSCGILWVGRLPLPSAGVGSNDTDVTCEGHQTCYQNSCVIILYTHCEQGLSRWNLFLVNLIGGYIAVNCVSCDDAIGWVGREPGGPQLGGITVHWQQLERYRDTGSYEVDNKSREVSG